MTSDERRADLSRVHGCDLLTSDRLPAISDKLLVTYHRSLITSLYFPHHQGDQRHADVHAIPDLAEVSRVRQRIHIRGDLVDPAADARRPRPGASRSIEVPAQDVTALQRSYSAGSENRSFGCGSYKARRLGAVRLPDRPFPPLDALAAQAGDDLGRHAQLFGRHAEQPAAVMPIELDPLRGPCPARFFRSPHRAIVTSSRCPTPFVRCRGQAAPGSGAGRRRRRRCQDRGLPTELLAGRADLGMPHGDISAYWSTVRIVRPMFRP